MMKKKKKKREEIVGSRLSFYGYRQVVGQNIHYISGSVVDRARMHGPGANDGNFSAEQHRTFFARYSP